VFCVGTEELRIRLAQRLPGIIFLMVCGTYFVVRQSGWQALPAQDLADEIRLIIGGIHRRILVVVDNYDTILYGHWWIILNGIYDTYVFEITCDSLLRRHSQVPRVCMHIHPPPYDRNYKL
jgi:hypothetical protein